MTGRCHPYQLQSVSQGGLGKLDCDLRLNKHSRLGISNLKAVLVFEQHIIEYGIIQDLKIYSTSPDPKPKSARDGIFRAKPAGDNARAGTFIIHDGLDWPRDPFTCRALQRPSDALTWSVVAFPMINFRLSFADVDSHARVSTGTGGILSTLHKNKLRFYFTKTVRTPG